MDLWPNLPIHSIINDKAIGKLGHKVMVLFRRGPGPKLDLVISKNAQNSACGSPSLDAKEIKI